jgi:3-hydroxy acid dehydrogenase / malonic semialdehyde reductase
MNKPVAIVTGASSGIGRATSTVFAGAGYHVVMWARRPEALAEVGAEIAQSGGSAEWSTLDIRNAHDVQQAMQRYSKVDVLVNNAGLSRGLGPLHKGEQWHWEEMIDTNLKGLLYVTRAVLPIMVQRGTGTVVNVASVAARQPYPGGNVYAATKAAVKMISDSLQLDVLGTGVRVCNIDPGMVETEFSEVRFEGDVQRAATVYKGLTPLTGYDVAEAILWAVQRPAHVCVQDILLMPTHQATTTHVHRKPVQ